MSILISLDYVPVVTIYSCFFLQKYCWIWELRDQSWDGWHRHMRTEWVFIPQQAFLRLQVHGSKLPFALQNNKHTNFSSRIWITEGLSFSHSLCSFSPLKKLSGRGGMSGMRFGTSQLSLVLTLPFHKELMNAVKMSRLNLHLNLLYQRQFYTIAADCFSLQAQTIKPNFRMIFFPSLSWFLSEFRDDRNKIMCTIWRDD